MYSRSPSASARSPHPSLQNPLRVVASLYQSLPPIHVCPGTQPLSLLNKDLATLTTTSPQLRAVDEISVQESNANRKALTDVTIQLQIISKDVNKLISDVDVAARNLAKTQEALVRLDQQHVYAPSTFPLGIVSSPSPSFPLSSAHSDIRRQLDDTLQYLHSSMDKQKMWLHNYRDRKDIAMSLVFNLVTQQDAANNIVISEGMKRDSSSMNGIALLTMVFLPGTFTSVSTRHSPSSFAFKSLSGCWLEVGRFSADNMGMTRQTILGAGLFSAFAQNREIHVSGLWWFWAAITFPLTGAVLLLWGVLCWRKEFRSRWARIVRKRDSRKDNGGSDDVEAKG